MAMPSDKSFLEISTSSIIRVCVILLGIGFLFTIWEILASVFLAIVIAASVEPGVRKLRKFKVPRFLAALIIYCVGFLVITAVFYSIIPVLIFETKELSSNIPGEYEGIISEVEQIFGSGPREVNVQEDLGSIFSSIQGGLVSGASNVFTFTFNLFGGLFSFILIVVISFYLVLQKDGIEEFLKSIVPSEHQEYALDLWKRVQFKLGKWFQSQLLLGVSVGLLMFIVLSLMRVEYAATIALMAAVLEIIPMIGPIIVGFIAFVLIAFQSPMLALGAMIAYIIIQQIQQQFLIPSIMSKAIGLNPIIIIVALLVGAKLIGFWGLILAIPFSVTLAEFVKDFRRVEKGGS
jgi:predicted PurR-regulated permease PerM